MHRLLRAPWARTTWLVALLGVTSPRPAAAETLLEANGAVNLRWDRTETPAAELETWQLDVRPSAMIQVGTPRLVWRGAYLFSGTFGLRGGAENAYSNNLDLSLAAQFSERSTMTLAARLTQGGSEFRMSQGSPESGEPAFRAPGNPVLVTALLEEDYLWESERRHRVQQTLGAQTTALQDALGRVNVVLSGSVEVERLYPRDAFGLVYAPRLAMLTSLVTEDAPYVKTVTNSVLGTWNHDFDPRWNAEGRAGAEQVHTVGGDASAPIHPVGNLTVRYFAGDVDGALELTRGAIAHLETGRMTLTDSAILRGAMGFGPTRQLAASVGFMRSRPLVGGARVTEDALSGDVGLVWGLWEDVLANVRYSVAYQFGVTGVVETSLLHVVLVGITARYGNTPYVPPVPVLGGGRVDRGDAAAFPGQEREQEQEREPPE